MYLHTDGRTDGPTVQINDSSCTIPSLSAGSHTVSADWGVTLHRDRNRQTSFKDARLEMSLEVHEDWIYRYSLRCDILSEKLESTKVNTNSFHATHDRQYLVLKLLSFFYEYMCCVLKHPWYLFLNLAEISGFTLSPPPQKR